MSCAALSSSVAAPPLSARTAQRRRVSPSISNPFVRNSVAGSAPLRRRWTRKLRPVTANTVQEQEDDVIVEDSFKSKSFPDTESSEGGPAETAASTEENWTIKFEHSVNFFLTETVIKILEILYYDRNYARFYVLETIARVPYFAFISVLHLYESFGWWRRADYLKVHFAESWNEMHHLLIMEELGGNKVWFDRFLAQNIAVIYYFVTVFMYLVSPRMAYHLSECVERHAYSSYNKFLKLNDEELKKLPAPQVAISYYMDENLYMFDEFHTSGVIRRPKIENLYDVFVNIREDELEHCKTMNACQTPGNLRSPHSQVGSEADGSSCDKSRASCYGIVDCIKKSFR